MEDDVERFFKESSRSFNQVKIKNQRERAVHKHRADGLDHAAKQARFKMERAQRDMVAHLQQLKTDQVVCGMTDLKEKKQESECESDEEDEDRFINPFPITFKTNNEPETDFEKLGKKYAARRGRRMSKEFEDLGMHTSTGQLFTPDARSRSNSRFLLPPIAGLDRSRSGSSSSLANLRQFPTLGQPEYIKSVRRPRKSVDQQQDQLDTMRAYSKLENSRMLARTRSSGSDIKNPFERSATRIRNRATSVDNVPISPRSRPTSAMSTRSSVDSPFTRKGNLISVDIAGMADRQNTSSLGYLVSPMISRKQFRKRLSSASSTKSEISPRSEFSPRSEGNTSPQPEKDSPRAKSPQLSSKVVIQVISCDNGASPNDHKECTEGQAEVANKTEETTPEIMAN